MITGLFLTTSLAVIVTPGPDAALVTHLVLRTGAWQQATAAAVGMIGAGAGHAVAALSGASMLVTQVPVLFTALVWAGAALLFVLGVKALQGAVRPPRATVPNAPEPTPTEPPRTVWRCVALGLLSTGGNPKVGLFFLAYLPQFVPAGAAYGRSLAMLAAVYLVLGTLWLAFLITAVHLFARRVRRRGPGGAANAMVPRVANAVGGMVFIALAVRLLWQG
ncbi:LysE family translocator [Streptomyces albipurpureus]|uniref:LysE family transporter n=1 Tax=Streptomyces albipurpureus TaxID=2897419 RepID=A0ABT0ULV1_9ACTN|nr:LysE family transporter [Streptomyces sp. CWNU-1]MCM2388373.1 LysE family transporter [Streptomyces sp. CWNU-1]